MFSRRVWYMYYLLPLILALFPSFPPSPPPIPVPISLLFYQGTLYLIITSLNSIILNFNLRLCLHPPNYIPPLTLSFPLLPPPLSLPIAFSSSPIHIPYTVPIPSLILQTHLNLKFPGPTLANSYFPFSFIPAFPLLTLI